MLTVACMVQRVLLRATSNVKGVSMTTSAFPPAALGAMVRSLLPEMTYSMHKGQCGRIGIVGGCKEYTGAPYFAAISALKMGADIAHVFCAQEASPVIKSYSPELIVHPVLDCEDGVSEFSQWLPRLHSLVIGPGLGRDQRLLDTVKGIIEKAKAVDMPLVIDADGMFLITKEPNLIKNYSKTVLTPNAIEFSRLFQKLCGKQEDQSHEESIEQLSEALGGVTIVLKGPFDIIGDGQSTVTCGERGSPRRCGGQGDLLSGALGAFLHWAYWAQRHGADNPLLRELGPAVCAGYAACVVTRMCNRQAYTLYRRSMTTTDMIGQIHRAADAIAKL